MVANQTKFIVPGESVYLICPRKAPASALRNIGAPRAAGWARAVKQRKAVECDPDKRVRNPVVVESGDLLSEGEHDYDHYT